MCAKRLIFDNYYMKPVVDFRVDEKFSPALSAFLEQLWVELARTWPGQPFIFLTEEAVGAGQYPPNIVIEAVKKSSFGWLDQKRLLNLLAERQADAYIGFGQAAMNIMLPSGSLFSKKDLQQPSQRIVFSDYGRLQLAPLAGSAPTRFLRPALPGILSPLSWTEAESIRTQYTGGREYFLYYGDIDEEHRLIELLKAFSSFKKRQQSNMQLVIAGYTTAGTDAFDEKLASYKYRADVVVLKDLSYAETLRLAAACYAVVGLSEGNALCPAVLMAVQGGAALIASDTPVNRELAGGAAAWADNARLEETLGQSMMLLYKDEDSKQVLVQKAKELSSAHDHGEMLAALAQMIYPH
jgi:glycosyltransferase involved in cell wall biosynthesis